MCIIWVQGLQWCIPSILWLRTWSVGLCARYCDYCAKVLYQVFLVWWCIVYCIPGIIVYWVLGHCNWVLGSYALDATCRGTAGFSSSVSPRLYLKTLFSGLSTSWNTFKSAIAMCFKMQSCDRIHQVWFTYLAYSWWVPWRVWSLPVSLQSGMCDALLLLFDCCW